MAKKDKAFWDAALKKAGYDDATRATLLAPFENKAFEDELYSALVPREESDRILTDSQRAKAEADAAKQQAVAKYTENLQWFEANKTRLTQAERADAYQRQVAAYEALYGPLNGNQPQDNGQQQNGAPAAAQPKYLTPEELAASQRNFWTMLKQVDRAKERYQEQFGKAMPMTMVDELEAMAQKPENANRSVTDMFNEHIAPRIDEKRTADIEAKIKAARDEAYNQGFSKGRMNEPTQDNPENVSPFYATKPNGTTPAAPDEATAMRNFIETIDERRPSP